MEDAARSTESRGAKRIQKSYFDVLGICCHAEVTLIQRMLKPVDGIHKVSVIVPSKTVIVEHDATIISQLQIVKVLNQARLEATIRAYGTDKIITNWPSPYILACGILLVVSLFQRFFHPLKWLAIAAVAIGLPPIVLRSIAAIQRYLLDINILMLIAVGGALALRDFSEAGFIVFLFTIAGWLETRASHKATAGMSALMSMAPQKAILAATGQVVDARDVQVNTILTVKAGEVIPIDGVVVEGNSEVNEQSLTGESFPVAKQTRSLVWAGTLNIDGYINVKTSALAEHSAVAKIARIVEEAQTSRPKSQRLIDSCAKYYTPAVVVIAGGVAVIPLMLRVHNPKHWFQLAIVLLVSACPCALVLSTPVATFCALLKAARIGLFVKGGDILEALAKTKVIAFDKTGTITRGEFSVVELQPVCRQVTMEALLYWISSIESKSSHPMASALVDYARSKFVEPKPENVSDFQIYPGEGVYGEIDNKQIYIGNKRIATRAGCVSDPNLEGEGMKEAVTLGYVFSGAMLIGTFSLSDSCRIGAAEAMQELKSLGVKIAMLTGDSTAAALHANNQLGQVIEIVHAGLLPEDKVRIVDELKAKEGPTAMVGDGVNDAPALATANVGISMGISGSAVAVETSHIILMSNDILRIPKAIQLAKKTHQKIIANILFSVTPKMAILALAVAGHPLLWAAVLADMSDVQKDAQCGTVCCSDDGRKEQRDQCETGGCCKTQKEERETEVCCSSLTQKKETGGCCETQKKECEMKACCSSLTQKKETGGCCKTEKNECEAKVCCSPHTQEKETCGCCKTRKEESETKVCCSSLTQKKETGGCCKTEKNECEAKVCCSPHTQERGTGGCCKTEKNECETKVCCSPHTQGKETGGCCKTRKEESETKVCCSSLTQGKETGGCCKTEKKECCSSHTQGKETGGCCKTKKKDCCSSHKAAEGPVTVCCTSNVHGSSEGEKLMNSAGVTGWSAERERCCAGGKVCLSEIIIE